LNNKTVRFIYNLIVFYRNRCRRRYTVLSDWIFSLSFPPID
jgi:hypothetical protein